MATRAAEVALSGGALRQRTFMENSELLNAVRRPLSPDSEIEIPASRSEFVRVVEILEEEGVKYPRRQYDGVRQAAIVSAAPSPLHGEMVGQLLNQISRAVDRTPGLNEDIKDRVSIATDISNTTDTGAMPTTRDWDGAIRYLTTEEETGPSHMLMIAVEVVFAQTYASLRAAISYSVCALRCRVGIAMCINEGDRGKRPSSKYYATIEEKRAAIQDVERALRSQLQTNPFGPLKVGNDTWFGKVEKVVLETYRLQNEATPPPDTLLDPTRSFTIVDDGGFVGGQVPANLAEITLSDCIPTHLISGNNIEAIPVNFFHQDWFENSFRSSMLETAMNRVKKKCKVQHV
ncbi:uncharacterized protein V1513DRAFT_453387 [Lipomyces chichibuensis]|uniref:uncharacterized protein n=1 Tax=Lipomyces chichibuensis TaxID=1546026 RepID=UPI003343FBB6